MSQSYEPSFTLLDIRRALLKHKGKALAFFAGTMLVAVAAIFLCPKKYASDAKLFIRVGHESVSLDPTATTGQTIDMFESREVEINSILEVLRSRSLAEKVVDKLGVDVMLEKNKKSSSSSMVSYLTGGLKRMLGRDQVTSREKAIEKLQKMIDIDSPKRTSIITVRCKASSPKLAQQIVTTLLDAFQLEHARVNRTAGSYEFFVQQSNLLDQKLKLAVGALRDAKNEMKLASIEGRRDNLQNQISVIETRVVDIRAQWTAAQARAVALSGSIATLPERMVTEETKGHANGAADNMHQLLYQLQIQEQDLLSKFTDKHPQVQSIHQQVERVKGILAKQPPLRTQSTTAKNPARQALELDLLTEQANVSSLQAHVKELLTQHDLVIVQLKTLNINEVRIAQLQRDSDLAEANYRTYAEKLEQARIDIALETDRISNVNVVQAASFIGKPVSPRLSLVLALALLLGGSGSLATALLAESFDNSLRPAADQVERRRIQNGRRQLDQVQATF